jgi:hypothetical protein
MVVTAAAVGAATTIGTTAMSMSGAMGGGGGGSAPAPNFKPVPQNPQDKAMKDYFERMTVANADKTYPAFSGFLESGGDPDKAKFDLTMPGMKPSEAAAFGFVGPKGETIPTVNYADAASGDVTNLTTEQRIYLAKERAGQAATSGQKPGPWAGKMQQLGGKIGRLQNKLDTKFTPTPEVEPRETKIISKLEKLRGRQTALAGQGDK